MSDSFALVRLIFVVAAASALPQVAAAQDHEVSVPSDIASQCNLRIGSTVDLDNPYLPISRLQMGCPEAFTIKSDQLEITLSTANSAMEEIRRRSTYLSASAFFSSVRFDSSLEDVTRRRSQSLTLRFWRRVVYIPSAMAPTEAELAVATEAAGAPCGDHVVVGAEREYALAFSIDLSQLDEAAHRDLRSVVNVDVPFAKLEGKMKDRIEKTLAEKRIHVTVECIGGSLGEADIDFSVKGSELIHAIVGHIKMNPPARIPDLDDPKQTFHPILTKIIVRPLDATIPFGVWESYLKTVRPLVLNALFAREQAATMPSPTREAVRAAADKQMEQVMRWREVYKSGSLDAIKEWVDFMADGDKKLSAALVGPLPGGALLGFTIVSGKVAALVPDHVGEPVSAVLAAGDVVRVTGQVTYHPLQHFTNLLVDAVTDAEGRDVPQPKLLGGMQPGGDGRAVLVMDEARHEHRQCIIDAYYEIPITARYRFGLSTAPHSGGVGGPNDIYGGSLRVELVKAGAGRK